MPIYEQIQNLLQQQATIANTNALAQERIQTIMMNKRAMEAEDRRLSVLQATSPQAQVAQEDQQYDKTSGPVALAENNLKRLQQRASEQQKLSRELLYAGDLKGHEATQLEVTRIGNEINRQQGELMKERQAQLQQVGSLARSVDDEDSFNDALPEIRKLNPAFGFKGSFDRNPITGDITYGPRTQKYMEQVGNASMSAADQIKDKREARRLVWDQAEEKRKTDLAEAQIRHLNAQTARDQAAANKIDAGGNATTTDKEERKAKQALITRLEKGIENPAKQQVADAKDSVQGWFKASYPGSVLDSTASAAMAGDVARRVNELQLDAVRADKPRLKQDDAFAKAIDEFKGFVVKGQEVQGGFDLGFWQPGSKPKYVYNRLNPPKEGFFNKTGEKPETKASAPSPKNELDAAPAGSKATGSDGKTYIKQADGSWR